MEQHVRYVRSADGTNIAYSDTGEGVPLVISSNIWTHLELTWNGEAGPGLRQLLREGFRLVRYDMRGMGMSDHNVEDFSLARQMEDIDAICERVQLERFALLGLVHATPACIAYAAGRPERLTHLILSVPFANGEEWYRATPTLHGLESFRELSDDQWELYTVTHAAALTALTGGADAAALARLMQASTTPLTLRRYLAALREQDVAELLDDIATPTMVIDSNRAPRQLGFARSVAVAIRNATLVSTEQVGAPSFAEADHTTRFVFGRQPAAHAGSHEAVLRTHGSTAIILFADIADSTALTERMGDAAFREKARALDEALRDVVRKNGGAAIDGKLLGDGILATFPAASQAIAAALACGAAGDVQALPLHLGLHAGDVLRETDPGGQINVYGGAVNIASRISALSAPGDVLVSRTVADLARTSAGVTFEDRGEHALKGIDEPQRVYAVRREAGA